MSQVDEPTPPDGHGRPPSSSDDMWAVVASQLTPEKAAERLDEYTKTLLSTVTFVGAVLTGLGLFSGATVLDQPVTRVVAAAAVVMAVASVIISLRTLAGGSRRVSVVNLAAVVSLIAARARGAAWAGGLLTLSLLLATLAVLAHLTLPKTAEATPSFSLVSTGTDKKVTLRLDARNLSPGEAVAGWLTATASSGAQNVIGQQTTFANNKGNASIQIEANGVRDVSGIQATTIVADRTCTATLPVAADGNFGGPSAFRCSSRS